MSRIFEPVRPKSFEQVLSFYRTVVQDMRANGKQQWEWGNYPSLKILQQDLQQNALYCIREEDGLLGAFVISPQPEEEYAQLSWHFGVRPATLHRLAIRSDCYGEALMSDVLDFVKQEALRLGYDSLRLDAAEDNALALSVFRQGTAREAGGVCFDEPRSAYRCFETPLNDECPLLPIRMYPAYRYGEMTPWGGDALRTVFHKRIPDERTGEALEISAVPGLESRDETGVPLCDLLKRYTKRLTGECEGEFPLLLKLLSSKSSLSVQVHPDDAYAREHEGKFGKNEAWVILHADKGSELLYGMREGVTKEALEKALTGGEDVEPMIARVPVQAGDVFSIPAGMVHAIGGGILLYEIQQSSDVTYRLWDYNRANDKGEKRPLHIRQSLDVIEMGLRGERTILPQASQEGIHRLLSVPAFQLDCLCVNGEAELEPHSQGFRMFTALAGLLLRWDGDALELAAGESVLLPASCPAVSVQGVGRALIAQER